MAPETSRCARVAQYAYRADLWSTCTVRELPPACFSPESPTDLPVRIAPKAIARASDSALRNDLARGGRRGRATFLGPHPSASESTIRPCRIFSGGCSRTRLLIYCAEEAHSAIGLMRARWSAEDLKYASSRCLGLPRHSALLMEREALRRARRGASLNPVK
jgi:hypothetical protein